MDDELKALARSSLQQALAGSPDDLGSALAEFGWREFAAADEAFACTTLFEEQGYLGADTVALDVTAAAMLGIDGAVSVIWPLGPDTDDAAVDGVALRGVRVAGQTILAPAAGRVRALDASLIEEIALGGMARGTRWVRVRAVGPGTGDLGPWVDVQRRCRLAIASELAGVARRIIDIAAQQVSARRQFGRPIGTYQSVRFRLAEAYAEVTGAKALIAAAWEDCSPIAASCAKAAAGAAHDSVAKHALQVCGAIGLSAEHPLPALVRRGFVLDALLGASLPEYARLGHGLFLEQLGGEFHTTPPSIAIGSF